MLNGPNLDLLGEREPALYGHTTLADLEATLTATAAADGITLRCAQSNHEGALIEHLHAARRDCDGVIINPAGYGHTSVALRDALLATALPAVEVHLTNLARREAFRRHTLTGDVVIGQISGFGIHGYHLALTALAHHLRIERTA
ncbi:MAG: type II 3-dehydroquinate dehydratase [bacterium]